MAQQLWFGTPQRMQWVPMPSSGMQRRDAYSSESGTLDRGGAYVTRSTGRHAEFDFSFGIRESSGGQGLNVFNEYASGMWDDYTTITDGFNPNNLLYFADPMSMRANLFSPQWAAPMRSLSGDYPWIGSYLSNAATSANIYRQPSRTVTFNVTQAATTLPTSMAQRFLIPIPPGYTLRWGWSGAVTGTGAMRVEAHTAATGAIVSSHPAALAVTGSTRLNSTFNGDTYDYVTIGISRTTAVASTVAIASMMAQIHINSFTPSVIGEHVDGVGQTGCEFDGEAVTMDYIMADDSANRRLMGMSFGLTEIGAWLP